VQLFFATTVFGLYLGAAYAIAASGLVLTYTTTRVFNLAHGATSMVMAFIYWQLKVDAGLSTWLALVLVLLVIAPLFGLVLERVVMRGLGEAPVSVSLVVTVAMFMLLVGVAMQAWPTGPTSVSHNVDYFFGYDAVTIFGTRIGYHYLITIAVSAAVAAGLYVLLNRTRTGTAMRAAVDNRELLQLFGASSTRVSMLSWSVGSMLAALGGVLLAAQTSPLDYYQLTFLVIASFSAAMVGRLQNLPLTFVGAVALGLGQSYIQNYVHGSAYIQTGLQSSLPTFLLFVTLLFVPQVRLRVGQVRGILAARVPSARQSLVGAVAVVLGTLALLPLLGANDRVNYGTGLVFGIVMLSLVLLTGYGGYVSLGQFAFVGVGAAVVAKLDTSSPLALVLAMLIAAAVGGLVALPVLRLTGLYLALATLAFAELMEKLVFQADFLFGTFGKIDTKRASLFGYSLKSTASYDFFILVLFLLIGIALLTLRRGPVGRMLIALRDSQAACSTLGLNHRWFRVAVFSVSAGIAGLAGALWAQLETYADPAHYAALQSLPLILVAVVAGVTTVSGAFVGGILLMLVPVVQRTEPDYSGVVFLVIAVGAILLSRDPNGLVNLFFKSLRRIWPRLPLPALPARRGEPSGDADTVDVDSPVEAQVAGHGVA
jgi:branched-chain amino acid transport system permease protein